ncbi:MAG TPA: hypothetical protein VJI98_04240 [Candidatus Nanoarchaeia archaeon]|nr:hypothetical protein [Candidatus Nanoarchaeia archaeon]
MANKSETLILIQQGLLKPTIDSKLYHPDIKKCTQTQVNNFYRRITIREGGKRIFNLNSMQRFQLQEGFVYVRDYDVDGNNVFDSDDPNDWNGFMKALDQDYGGLERKAGIVVSSQGSNSYKLGDKNYRLVQSVGEDGLSPIPFSLYVRFVLSKE